MCNIVSGRDYANKWQVSRCCCGCSLRAGTLGIGWFCLISTICWIVNAVRGHGNANYIGLVSAVITGLLAIFILIGIYKSKIKLVWASVYLLLILTLWYLVMAILFFALLVWPVGIVALIVFLLDLYFFLVVRSYAYEAEESMPKGNPA